MNKKIVLILLAIVLTLSFSMVLVSCHSAVNIDHIEIYSMPKTDYLVGESLDITDAKILVVYKNNTEQLVDITPSMLSDFNSSTLGTQYINVYYENHSAVFAVNVSRYPVSTVELIVPASNVNYVQDQLLRTDGTYMQINFQDGSYERIAVTKDMCSGFDSNDIGSQTITVRATLDGVEYTGSFGITVEAKELIAIEVTTAPTKNIYYIYDDVIDLRGGVLLFKYNSGYSTYVDMTDVNGNPINGLSIEWDTSVVSNNSNVTVKYQHLTSNFQVQVKIRDVASYEILNNPKTQKQNLDLDLTGTVIKLNYNNGESETVTLPSDKVEIQNYDKSLVGKQTVALVFKYGEGVLATGGTMDIEVEERKPVEDNPFELVDCVIYQDTEFDVSDVKVRIVFDNGEYGDPVALNNAMIEWPNGIAVNVYSEAGKKSWRISYMGLTADCDFIVEALRVTNIELFNVSNVFAYTGDNALAHVGDANMTITYNSGLVKENVALDPEMLTFDATTTGVKKATLTYTDKYEPGFVKADALNVTVVKEISSVVIGGSYKTEYVIGEKFDTTGMILEVNYEGAGEAEFVNANDFGTFWTFRSDLADGSLTFNKVGTVRIYLVNLGINEGDEFSFTVNVTNNLVSLALYKIDELGNYVETNSLGTVVQGLPIDLTDYRILATYQGSYEYVQVTSDMLDYNFKDNSLGQRTVVVTYEGLALADATDPITVNVVARNVKGIKVIKSPDKTIYVQESASSVLSYEGLKLNLVYDNETTTPIDVTQSVDDATLSFAGLDINKIGTQTITVTYIYGETSYQDTFEIEVLSPEPKSISWSDGVVPESYLTIGAAFNLKTISYVGSQGYLERLADKKINVENSNGIINNDISLDTLIDNFTVTGYTATQTGLQTVHLKYGSSDLYLAVRVHVEERVLKKINLLINGADKLTVIQGAPIDLANLKLELVFNDDATSVVPMDASYINVSEANPNGYDVTNTDIGTRNVTISYTYANETTPVTLTLALEVYQKSLTEIVINDIPKQYYVEGESYDKSQGSIMLYYNNGTTMVVPLAEATIGNDNSSFNIDIRRFNNEEFTGFSKAQRIEIKYGACKTSYTIYMRDRRNAFVELGQDNQYSIVYGTTTKHVIKLMGYDKAFTAEEDVKEFNKGSFTVEYIPQEVWLDVGREFGVDYTVFPSKVGVYYIVVSYAGDSQHNAYEQAVQTLTINKKTLYVTIANATMIYGCQIPEIKIMLSADGVNFENDPMSLFVEGDNFTSPNFNPEVISGTVAYLVNAKGEYVLDVNGDKIVIDIFNIVYKMGNSVVDVFSTSKAGSYSIDVQNKFVSPNYDIQYKYGALTINPRKVLVTPQDLSYTYGTAVVPVIPFTVSAVSGEEDTTGLLPTDVLGGALSRENSDVKMVGDYKVTIGSLHEFNKEYYQIDLVGEAYVRIIERIVYVKTDSVIKVYGEPFTTPAVKFYSDATCTIEYNAFAEGDVVELDGGILDVSKVGSVDISNIAYNETTPAGTYDDMAADFVLTEFGAANYKVVLVAGVLEVSKRPVAVVADTVTVEYGESGKLTYKARAIEGDSASGLLASDMQADGTANEGVFTGALDRVNGTNVGEYTILIGDLASSNYAISFVSAKYVITPKALYVKIADTDLTKVYDGKKPVVNNYILVESKSDVDDCDKALEIKRFIEIIVNGSKDVTTDNGYTIVLKTNNNNYTVSLAQEYWYSITPVIVEKIDYVGLPAGDETIEYDGAIHTISATINKNYLMPQYNDDGTEKTDDNGATLYDDNEVILSLTSVINAGEYKVSAIGTSDSNYVLNGVFQEIIVVSPRILNVVINCNSSDENTFEREYNGRSAYLQSGIDYSVEHQLGDVELPYYSLSIYRPGYEDSANISNVLIDDVGNIQSYSIKIAQNSEDPNYRYELKAEYKYKIIPQKVRINVYPNYLSKTYDGLAPSLSNGMYYPTKATIGFDLSTVTFGFERMESDNRSNSTVGKYSVSLDCIDPNFDVALDKPTIYEIKKESVVVNMLKSSKPYAEKSQYYRVLIGDLSFTTRYLNNILNFYSYTDGNDVVRSEYDDFSSAMSVLFTQLFKVEERIKAVQFTNINYAKSCINDVINALNEVDGTTDLLAICTKWATTNHANKGLLDDSFVAINDAVASLKTTLESFNSDSLNGSISIERAKQNFEEKVSDRLSVLKELYDYVNTYVAFIFETNPELPGEYMFTFEYSDVNREIRYPAYNKTVTVNQFDLYLVALTGKAPYNTTPEAINNAIASGKDMMGKDFNYYEIVDKATGEAVAKERYAEILDGYVITMTISGYVTGSDVGSYAYDLEIKGGEDSPYSVQVDVTMNKKFEITPIEFTYKIVQSAEDTITYGTNVGQLAAISKGNMSVDNGKYISLNQWLKDAEGRDVTIPQGVVFSFSLYKVGVDSPVSGLLSAGDYVLQATESSNNYEIIVEAGAVKVNKKELTIINSYQIGTPIPEETNWFTKPYSLKVESGASVIGTDNIIHKVKYEYDGFIILDNGNIEGANDIVLRSTMDGGKTIQLSNMQWGYELFDNHPFAANTTVEDTKAGVAIELNSAGYEMDNYFINFDDVRIHAKVVKKEVVIEVKPVEEDGIISAYYMGEPDKSTYMINFNGVGVADLDYIKEAIDVEISFMDGDKYFDASSVNLRNITIKITNESDASYADVTKNYSITVSTESQYQVKARKFTATLKNVDAIVAESISEIAITPYAGEAVISGRRSTYTIKSGHYGLEDFEFNVDLTDVTDEELKTAILNYYNNEVLKNIVKFTSSNVIGGDTQIFEYEKLYKHKTVLVNDTFDYADGVVTVLMKLQNIETEGTNFAFDDSTTFAVTVHPALKELNVTKEGRLLESDLLSGDYSKHINVELLYALDIEGYNHNHSLAECNGCGINIDGIPTAINVSKLATISLDPNKFTKTLIESGRYNAAAAIIKKNLEEMYKEGGNNITVTVQDGRASTYTPSEENSIWNNSILLRFFAENSVETNPKLTKGGNEIAYRKIIKDGSGVYTTLNNVAFNAMHLEIAVKATANMPNPSFETYLSGNSSSNTYIKLVFESGALKIAVKENGVERSYVTGISTGNLFDGLTHDIRTYLDKEYLTLIITIDGSFGIEIPLKDVTVGASTKLFTDATALVQESKFELNINGDFAIRYLKLTEQGLYEKTGSHIKLPKITNLIENGNTLIASNRLSAVNGKYYLNATKFNALFGLYLHEDSGLVAKYYVNGNEAQNGIYELGVGVHSLELALYDQDKLVDYDNTIVYVSDDTSRAYIGTSTTPTAEDVFVKDVKLPIAQKQVRYYFSEVNDGTKVSPDYVKTVFEIASAPESNVEYSNEFELLKDYASLIIKVTKIGDSITYMADLMIDGVSEYTNESASGVYEIVVYKHFDVLGEPIVIIKVKNACDEKPYTYIVENDIEIQNSMFGALDVTVYELSYSQYVGVHDDYVLDGEFVANGEVELSAGSELALSGDENRAYDSIVVALGAVDGALGELIQIKLFDNHAGEGAYLIYSHDEENVWSLKLVVYNANSTTEAIVATLHESITYISVALDKLNNQIVIKNINKMRDYEQTAFDSAVILTDENGDPLIDEEDRQVVEIVEIGALNKTTITSKKDGILIKAYSTSIGENNAYVDKAITEESQI